MRSLPRLSLLLVSTITALASTANAQSAADSAGIRATVMDYIEGWYVGDGARMERALHPELAKRIVMSDVKNGRYQLESMGALTLINRTRAGGGTRTPEAQKQKDFILLDIYQNAAVAKVVASDWIDYLHLARWNGKWVIVNVLWELKPTPAP